MNEVLASKTATFEPMYQTVLGSDWSLLAEPVQNAHVRALKGRGKVAFEVSNRAIARIIAWMLRLPGSGEYAAEVEIERCQAGEIWRRRFGNHGVTTVQVPIGAGKVREQFKLVDFDLSVGAADRGIWYRSCSAHIRLGNLRLRFPKRFEPSVYATELPQGECTLIDIKVFFPRDHVLLSYFGKLEWGGA